MSSRKQEGNATFLVLTQTPMHDSLCATSHFPTGLDKWLVQDRQAWNTAVPTVVPIRGVYINCNQIQIEYEEADLVRSRHVSSIDSKGSEHDLPVVNPESR